MILIDLSDEDDVNASKEETAAETCEITSSTEENPTIPTFPTDEAETFTRVENQGAANEEGQSTAEPVEKQVADENC